MNSMISEKHNLGTGKSGVTNFFICRAKRTIFKEVTGQINNSTNKTNNKTHKKIFLMLR